MKRIGLIGYGTIGRFIADEIANDPAVEISFICRKTGECSGNLITANYLGDQEFSDLDLVIEASDASVAKEFGPDILKHTDFMIFSASALADETFYNQATSICMKYNTSIYIPHGAVLGLDGIHDGKSLLTDVSVTTTKTPKSFGVDVNYKEVIYDGSTRGACLAFPKNVNVHAVVALAGLGFDKTHSKVIADPEIKGNTHIIQVGGDGFSFEIKVESIPQGLVTGKYTPYSGLGSIKKLVSKKPGIIFV